ncbi:hypothetical protein Clacol_006484 [Clathrus columnatus]|uniref:USP domain-containing protein n=1 Tax=Clathrus columnatus TaxID=1419009 RepID=A0AAV5AFF8_9AGAM|nr:hypothetical protein Clacol_006484 [Clathrus columnatus]
MIYNQIQPNPLHSNIYPLTALAFDPVSDILWGGNSAGSLMAYHSQPPYRSVYFPVGGNGAVKKIISGESQVRAMNETGLGLGAWTKGGLNKWYFRPPSTSVSTFASHPNNTHSLILATQTPELIMLNTTIGSPIRTMPVVSQVTHLQYSHSLLISGSVDGFIRTHDVRSGTRRRDGATGEHTVRAHLGGLQGLDAVGNFVYSIGWGLRQSHPVADQFVRIFDLRALRPLTPIPFLAGPAFINVHPAKGSTVIVTSSQGVVGVIDVLNQGTTAPEFNQVETAAFLTATAISYTGDYLAFGAADGSLRLLSTSNGDIPFNGFEGQAIPWADALDPFPDISWNDETPLNSIGLPYYDTPLLSATSREFYQSVPFLPAPRIPQQILNSMKTVDFIGYAALPKELRGKRNMVLGNTRTREGRFRSSRASKQNIPDSPTSYLQTSEIPRPYRKVEIEYSKFGVEDFDFGFYNKTDYSGLETHILNSYTNALLQTLHYTVPVRRLAKSHITTNCQREHCLLCELGFVVRMLEDARGINCQAANFCKTISAVPQANQMSLVDYGREMPDVDYVSKIQAFNRFILEQFISEGNSFPHNPYIVPLSPDINSSGDFIAPAPAPITQLFGIDAKSTIICGSCGAPRDKEGLAHVVEMLYPKKALSNETPPPSDFASILRNSLVRDMSYRATCQTCRQLSTQYSRRVIPSKDLPPVLAVNACVYSEEHLQFWLDTRQGRFLPPKIGIRPGTETNQPGGVVEGMDDPDAVFYELRSIVVAVKEKTTHLVAIVKIPNYECRSETDSPWFIFNDFTVQNVSESEALSFPGTWKVPAILYLERIDIRENLNYSDLPEDQDLAILSCDTSISLLRDKSLTLHETLRFEELPTPGTLVAIDAEFVLMQQVLTDETEYRSDGIKKMIRPSRYGLARVSVLRGDGPKQGIPFIDDHIHTSETIVDYLTEWSGIRFGDLDPQTSKYTLVPLKVAYKKLRLLVDLGGTNGTSDIFVPPEQVIDTVDLYFLREGKRKLSLRFLSWFILKENIQTETHDSIEDARAALKLFKAYHDFEAQGIFEQKLEELYREGRQYNFRPPAGVNVVNTPLSSPPLGSPGQSKSFSRSSSQINPSNAYNFIQSEFRLFPPNILAGTGGHQTTNLFHPSKSNFPLHTSQSQNQHARQQWRDHR